MATSFIIQQINTVRKPALNCKTALRESPSCFTRKLLKNLENTLQEQPMQFNKSKSPPLEILVSDTFVEIHSANQTERFPFQHIKSIHVTGQTNYLITALSWLFELLFQADGAARYKNDYLEIITTNNQSTKWLLTSNEKRRVKKSIEAVKIKMKKR